MPRLSRLIAFGTTGYPETVARRLKVVNVICWLAAAMLYSIAVRRFFGSDPENWGLEPAIGATIFGAIPLLHRFGSAVAIVALIVLAFIDIWRVTLEAGTGAGFWLAFFTGSVFAVLMLGAERAVLSSVVAVISCVATVCVHLYVPFVTDAQAIADQPTMLLINVVRTHVLLFAVVLFGARQIANAEAVAKAERDRSDGLLVNILPAAIAERLKSEPGKKVADRYDEASVLFADMAGFTMRAAAMAPEALVTFLDSVFTQFDALVERHGLEKIKTTGDAYMVVSGVPAARPDHADALVALALDMLAAAARFDGGVPIRIGIASGPLVAGVVGSRKFFYDVWGDAVNMAARMESTGAEGRIHVAPETAGRLSAVWRLEARGAIEVKGKGAIETAFVSGPAGPA
ncbi:MAG: adenylate/guanylate cyclase domain-containing protein [Rhizobiaceae bacterium]|nr:adenylate/guanylate cyclase domain-containing protein [Rhizobiaceae bacterium]